MYKNEETQFFLQRSIASTFMYIQWAIKVLTGKYL